MLERTLAFIRAVSSRRWQVVVSAVIAYVIWAGVAAGPLRNTVVPEFDVALRDFALRLSVDSRADRAPGILHLSFDDEALVAFGLPNRVPADALADMLQVARYSGEAVVVDVDLATRQDAAEMSGLLELLRAWGEDTRASLLVLAHPSYSFSLRGLPMYLQLDEIVRVSPNIVWGDVGAYADHDGIIRDQLFWSCHGEGEVQAPVVIPSATLFIWARHFAAGPSEAALLVNDAFLGRADLCPERTRAELVVGSRRYRIERAGPIEYRTTIDAMLETEGRRIRYAADGLPRLLTIGYCALQPEACGSAAQTPQLGHIAAGRIVLISASNEFSHDEHLTPVGRMPGAIILGNAGRALINSGPPRTAHWSVQMLVIFMILLVIWGLWAVFGALNARAQRIPRRSTYLVADALTNPVFVKAYSLSIANLLAFTYYYHFFVSASWDGLVTVGWGATFAMAVAELRDWADRRLSSHIAQASRREA